MKIVFFTSGLSGGGAERVCCNLANFLCQREHDIEFITISDDEATYPLSTKISRQALLHQQERSNFLHDNLLRFYRVCKLIRKTRCDCYIVMLPIPHQSQNYRFGACRSLHVPSFETKAIEESCP